MRLDGNTTRLARAYELHARASRRADRLRNVCNVRAHRALAAAFNHVGNEFKQLAASAPEVVHVKLIDRYNECQSLVELELVRANPRNHSAMV